MSQADGRTMRPFDALEWRNIGPHRGGRVVAVAGHPTRRQEFYFGSTGGGVWRTPNAGITWENISDGYFRTSSVGALAVSEADPNVIYAGMGECSIRGNVSRGDGVYRSDDGGRTWRHLGLAETRHIARVRVHPQDPDLVYVAALGHAFGPNPERGVYRSRDGGRTWERILYRSEDAGAIDLSMDPNNPRILYAAFWYTRRQPWTFTSGGPGSGLFKSTDGGDTWVELTDRPGLPGGVKGKIGVAVSPAQPDRVWAIVEAREGGVFRSDDGGQTWVHTSARRDLRSRAWYYSHIYADPQDPDTVYVLNNFFWKSTDAGSSWTALATPHPDHHDLWIDPRDPRRMIHGNDGGACVSFDGGESWSTVYNQPTAEIYHVTVDTRFPYRVYGAQQDNTTISIPSRSDFSTAISQREWYSVGGAESGYIAVRPDDPNIVYAGSSGGGEGGRLTRYDHRTGQVREVSVWPEKTAGLPARDYTYRFGWTSPIHISPHDPNVLYSCGNMVFRSRDEGETWEAISPDLTRNDPDKLGSSGGPITRDHTGVEVYCTVFAFAESPVQQGLLWAGTDDGLVHVSKDGGATWENVTPPDLPEWTLVSIIEPSHHDAATCYVATTRYKLDDFRPLLFKTHDFGRTWVQISGGIPDGDYTRVIREDPVQRGLLYAGTESGIYVSFDDGAAWHPLRLNLPVVPVHDLAVKDDDLVAATHGRGFWILDDVSPLRETAAAGMDELQREAMHLFQPRDTVRFRGGGFFLIADEQPTDRPYVAIELPSGASYHIKRRPEGGRSPEFLDAGQNPPAGALIRFWLRDVPEGEARLSILDADGRVVRSFSTAAEREGDRLKVRPGANLFIWNLRGAGAETLPDAVYRRGYECAPLVPPGTYKVRLEAAGQVQEQAFRVVKDPRVTAGDDDLRAQFDLVLRVRDRVSDIHRAVRRIRSLREEIEGWLRRAGALEGGPGEVAGQGRVLLQRLRDVEEQLVQVHWESPQDTLNFPPGLNARVAHLAGVVEAGDHRPTRSMLQLFEQLSAEVDRHLQTLRHIEAERVPAFAELLREAGVPLIVPEV